MNIFDLLKIFYYCFIKNEEPDIKKSDTPPSTVKNEDDWVEI